MARLAAALLFSLALTACALAAPQNMTGGHALESLSLDDLDHQLQACPIVRELSAAKHARAAAAPSSLTTRLFAVLFPGSPAVNALLATLYISGPPNFLLALCPTDIDPSSLGVMVAFAVGGLLGDTLFHLLPEIFVGEDEPDRARFVLVEPNRNLVLGLAILVGLMTFVAMDKGLRIATGGSSGHGHAHQHSHDADADADADSDSDSSPPLIAASGVDAVDGTVKSRNDKKKKKKKNRDRQAQPTEPQHQHQRKEANPSVKLGGYLNLIADFTHNITDGLAVSASFYASPTIGATTTVAVFFHEIPHEVGDFALLVQSGFSKRAAMASQFVTAVGALIGTLVGIAIQEFGGASTRDGEPGMPRDAGLWGTSLAWGDMLLPFTAGTFLYVGTVAAIPELLETGPNTARELRKTLAQFVAVAAGAGIMLYISWHG
ncbi:imidazoleglycerol-phosphate dehydratase [Metarhizium album ARSEF 1941]|uniref:Imidazoleglycerol-phosphate dehydratase n=1 Tax=Metarhizium album (strain ARSEF 1941) TaxID=1081103 RepID=A0A0B2WPH7_METAS|nr:imidazoleglycerol-phosphate dehydratase [Metarhizium album ARSEF 1941]KHN97946.1 imidazoleglycerol-phosphate dehydratase [Metarhizium album ARSEF 1941]